MAGSWIHHGLGFTVIVATRFGIVERALRRKNLGVDETVASEEFQAIRDLLSLNSLQLNCRHCRRDKIISPRRSRSPYSLLH